MNKLIVVINGYGVPKDIMTDFSYYAYLIQIFNFLWENYRQKSLLIIPCGGPTDLYPPFKRTEAGEIAKWLKVRIKKLGLTKKWRLRSIATELSALENLLACRRFVHNSNINYFCERTREKKMRILASKIFGNKIRVIGIEFDGSASRYQLPGRKELENQDLSYSLLALKNPTWRKILRQAAEEKIRVLRKTPERVRATEIDRITRQIRDEYYRIYRKRIS